MQSESLYSQVHIGENHIRSPRSVSDTFTDKMCCFWFWNGILKDRICKLHNT